MEKILVSLQYAAEYMPANENGLMSYGSRTAEEFIIANDTDESGAVEAVSDLVASLLASGGAVSYGSAELRTVISFRKYIGGLVYPAPNDKEEMVNFTISDLRHATFR